MKTFLQFATLSAVLLMLAGITVSCNNNEKPLEPFLTVDVASITTSSEGGSYQITLSSNGEWTISVQCMTTLRPLSAWWTLSDLSGTNDGVVTIDISKNSLFTTRLAMIRITSGDLTRYVHISQAAATPLPEEFTVQFKLSPQTSNGLATENPEIQALVAKHGVMFYQSYSEFTIPQFLLYYTLTGYGYKHVIIQDFLATGLFDDNVRDYCIHFHCGVTLRLIPQADPNYLATENPIIQALIEKHGVRFRQTAPGSVNPESLLLYNLENPDLFSNREINMLNALKDFLATGLFEYIFWENRLYTLP